MLFCCANVCAVTDETGSYSAFWYTTQHLSSDNRLKDEMADYGNLFVLTVYSILVVYSRTYAHMSSSCYMSQLSNKFMGIFSHPLNM